MRVDAVPAPVASVGVCGPNRDPRWAGWMAEFGCTAWPPCDPSNLSSARPVSTSYRGKPGDVRRGRGVGGKGRSPDLGPEMRAIRSLTGARTPSSPRKGIIGTMLRYVDKFRRSLSTGVSVRSPRTQAQSHLPAASSHSHELSLRLSLRHLI